MQRPFSDTLRELRNGEALLDLAEQLQQVVNAVTDSGKTGSLTLTIEVKPFEKHSGALVLRDSIKTKLPKIETRGTVLFSTPDGNLTRNNPRQDDLPGITLANDKTRSA